jgi:hypothetical protein
LRVCISPQNPDLATIISVRERHGNPTEFYVHYQDCEATLVIVKTSLSLRVLCRVEMQHRPASAHSTALPSQTTAAWTNGYLSLAYNSKSTAAL